MLASSSRSTARLDSSAVRRGLQIVDTALEAGDLVAVGAMPERTWPSRACEAAILPSSELGVEPAATEPIATLAASAASSAAASATRERRRGWTLRPLRRRRCAGFDMNWPS